ncbi:MAG: pantetheine-phosphate adenylyltransferase [bacterium]|nr:pantetheine-phosphate adenylyltransferase [bacterium]
MQKYKTGLPLNQRLRGLLIGRFQPFHNGHLYLIKHALQKVDKLILAIGSANIVDDNNPFTTEQRLEMLQMVIKNEGIEDKITKIILLDDYFDNDKWYKNTIKKSGEIEVVIGNNDWTNSIFKERGYEIMEVDLYRRYIYEGYKIRTLMKNIKPWSNLVPVYLAEFIKHCYKMNNEKYFRYYHVAIGGTFDHLHKGHKQLINTALKYGQIVSIGITTDEFIQNKLYADKIELYAERKKSVISYIKQQHRTNKIYIFPLSSMVGSTDTDGTIEALVVSKDTFANAVKINKIRKQNHLPKLQIILTKMVKDNFGNIISSERIRKGEIDEEGKVWKMKKIIRLPESLRQELRKPLGKVIEGDEKELGIAVHKVEKFEKLKKSTMIISVGDIISFSLEREGIIPDVKIIDNRSRRESVPESWSSNRNSRKNQTNSFNFAGTISKDAVNAIQKTISVFLKTNKKQTIIIKGEEDLLALPAVLFAPIGSIILYGHWELGVIMVEVSKEKKKIIQDIVNKFV